MSIQESCVWFKIYGLRGSGVSHVRRTPSLAVDEDAAIGPCDAALHAAAQHGGYWVLLEVDIFNHKHKRILQFVVTPTTVPKP